MFNTIEHVNDPASSTIGFRAIAREKKHTSQVQPKNATKKNIHCLKLSIASNVNGFSSLSIGGFNVGIRVARYRPMLIF